ncbi:hypothetical protein CALCODRAFT_504781 [Calocera cornea HHB12733]|uniref:Uncharacterized protein n=1 Tax=Calocera cornea HHB12733 TaxID=1353952 RepID=A0A165C8H1_9BASI|nr:hypothetical protein CALCODRAFT_504781 [Calocera cornea HHB12733]
MAKHKPNSCTSDPLPFPAPSLAVHVAAFISLTSLVLLDIWVLVQRYAGDHPIELFAR